VTERDGVDVVSASEVVALEIALSSARVSNWRISREPYPAWKPDMPSGVALETHRCLRRDFISGVYRATPTSATTTSTPSLSACHCRRT